MSQQPLTREQIRLAYIIAVIADLIELPITAAELTVVGAPGGEAVACALDCIVMAALTRLLGFHWAFLPSFLVEVVPGLDLLPTWAGCVAFVVWQRKKETAQAPPMPAVIDVEEIPTTRLNPPLLAPTEIPARRPPIHREIGGH